LAPANLLPAPFPAALLLKSFNGNNALSETQTTAAEIFAATGYKTAAFIAAFVSGRPLGVEARV